MSSGLTGPSDFGQTSGKSFIASASILVDSSFLAYVAAVEEVRVVLRNQIGRE